MPRLPFGIANSELPATSGMRGGVVSTPVVQEPGLDAAAAMLPGRALAEFGQDLAQTGQHLQQAEAYQFQRQHAQSVHDSNLGFQDVVQRAQPAMAARLKGDYRDLAKDIVKIGKDVTQEVALQRKLSPEARALLQEKAEMMISQAQQKALETENIRFKQENTFSFAREVQQVQEDAANARDEGELMVSMGRLQSTLIHAVPAGLIDGGAAGKLYQDVEFAVRKDRASRAIWQNPGQHFQELMGMSEGRKPTSGALQNLPTPLIEPLLREAATRIGHVAQLNEADARRKQAQTKEMQDRNAITLTAELHGMRPVPENADAIDRQVERIRLAGPSGDLERDQHYQLLNHATAWAEKAKTYTPKDDEPKKKALQIALASSQTTEDFRWFKGQVAQNHAFLTGDSYQKLMQDADTYANRLHPLNREAYKEARRRILDWAMINPSSPAQQITGMLRTADQENTANALLALQSWAVGKTPDVVDQEALSVAESLMEHYLKQLSAIQVMKSQGISVVLQTGGPEGNVVPNEEWVIYALNKVRGMSDVQRGRELKMFETFRTSAAGKAALEKLYGTNPEKIESPYLIGPMVPPAGVTPRPVQPATTPSGSQTKTPAPGSTEPKAFPTLRK